MLPILMMTPRCQLPLARVPTPPHDPQPVPEADPVPFGQPDIAPIDPEPIPDPDHVPFGLPDIAPLVPKPVYLHLLIFHLLSHSFIHLHPLRLLPYLLLSLMSTVLIYRLFSSRTSLHPVQGRVLRANPLVLTHLLQQRSLRSRRLHLSLPFHLHHWTSRSDGSHHTLCPFLTPTIPHILSDILGMCCLCHFNCSLRS
ncbi:hypothetical protein Hanom_Chr02g00128511 [Helianthus anomalus]